jgi:hypothetical protein
VQFEEAKDAAGCIFAVGKFGRVATKIYKCLAACDAVFICTFEFAIAFPSVAWRAIFLGAMLLYVGECRSCIKTG